MFALQERGKFAEQAVEGFLLIFSHDLDNIFEILDSKPLIIINSRP